MMSILKQDIEASLLENHGIRSTQSTEGALEWDAFIADEEVELKEALHQLQNRLLQAKG